MLFVELTDEVQVLLVSFMLHTVGYSVLPLEVRIELVCYQIVFANHLDILVVLLNTLDLVLHSESEGVG